MPRSVALLLVTLLLLGCAWGRGSEGATDSDPPVMDYDFGDAEIVLDPLYARNAASLDVVAQLFEGLTTLDPEGQQVQPALALDWAVSGDGRTYSFRMRQNVAWINQEGEPQGNVSAEDMVFAIKRACAPGLENDSRTVLFIIRGCQEVAETQGIPDPDRVAVRAIEPYVVEFILNEPASYFPAILTLPIAWPLPHATITAVGEGWSEPSRLISNGPYRIADWGAKRFTLVRNGNYREAATVAIERVEGIRSATPDEALARYRANESDMMTLSEEGLAQVLADGALMADMTLVPDTCTTAFGLTTIKAPLDNARVRRALSLALEREALATAGQIPATTFMPPGILPPDAPVAGIRGNAAEAVATLAGAGYPGGQGFPPITLMVPSGPEYAALTAAIADRWRTLLNITVEVREHPAESYAQAITRTVPLPEMPHVWLLVWCARYPDPHAWLTEPLLVSNREGALDFASGTPSLLPPATIYAGENASRRIPTRFDELVQQATVAPEGERALLYARAEQHLLVDEAAVIPLYHLARPMLDKPWLTRTFNVPGEVHFREWRLDMAAKQAAQEEPEP